MGIIDFLADKLSNTYIFEMAYDRRKYESKLSSIARQIVENWCLVKYCNMFDEENYNRLHWSKELSAHLKDLQMDRLKKNLNKLKVTKQVLIEYEEFDDYEQVIRKCQLKWDLEGLPDDKLKIVAKEFANNIDNICEYICNINFDVKNYAYNEV